MLYLYPKRFNDRNLQTLILLNISKLESQYEQIFILKNNTFTVKKYDIDIIKTFN